MAGEIDKQHWGTFAFAAFGWIYLSAIELNNIHMLSYIFQFFLFNSYKSAIQGLGIDEQHVVKLVPNRIFSLTFHPAKYKTLLFAGDKWGNLGVWDVVRIIIKSEKVLSFFLGSLSKHDVDERENVIWKCNFAVLQWFFNHSKSLCLKNVF